MAILQGVSSLLVEVWPLCEPFTHVKVWPFCEPITHVEVWPFCEPFTRGGVAVL